MTRFSSSLWFYKIVLLLWWKVIIANYFLNIYAINDVQGLLQDVWEVEYAV